ncbi:MAG TPA: hypothetical protein VGK94_00535 [Candidatus Polarisedimenticolia bacterium]|jgi:hypothetical protein
MSCDRPEGITDRVDRSAFSVAKASDGSDEKAYWHSKTPEERLQAVELMRRIVYGDAASERIKRVFEVTRRGLD